MSCCLSRCRSRPVPGGDTGIHYGFPVRRVPLLSASILTVITLKLKERYFLADFRLDARYKSSMPLPLLFFLPYLYFLFMAADTVWFAVGGLYGLRSSVWSFRVCAACKSGIQPLCGAPDFAGIYIYSIKIAAGTRANAGL